MIRWTSFLLTFFFFALFSLSGWERVFSAQAPGSSSSKAKSPEPIVLPHATLEEPYWIWLPLVGAEGKVQSQLIEGRLPPGLSLKEAVVEGRPTELGEYLFTILAKDEAGQTARARFQLQVIFPPADPLTIPKLVLPPCIACTYYQVPLSCQGGYAPYQWKIRQGQLPEGLRLKDHFLVGEVRRFISQPEKISLEVEVTDRLQHKATQTLTITLQPNEAIRLRLGAWGKEKEPDAPRLLPPAIVGQPYLARLPVQGGYGKLRFHCDAEQLPPGLEVAEAALEGTPTQVGQWAFSVLVEDSLGQQLRIPLELEVFDPPPPPLRMVSPPLPPAWLGQPYRAEWKAEGGYPPYRWKVEGVLPSWLQFQDGALWGTPPDASALGEYQFTIHLADAHGARCPPAPAKLQVQPHPSFPPPKVLPKPLPLAIVDQPYQTSLLIQGGLPPYQIKLLHGTLPPGLQMLPTGHLLGKVEKEGDWQFTLQIVDSLGQSSSGESFRLTARRLGKAPLQLNGCARICGVVGKELRVQFGASGGLLPYRFSRLGELPPGLDFVPEKATLQGIPTTAGSWKIQVKLQDSAPSSEEVALPVELQVVPPPPWTMAMVALVAGIACLLFSLVGGALLWIRTEKVRSSSSSCQPESSPSSASEVE